MKKPEIFAMRFCPSDNKFNFEDSLVLYIQIDEHNYITTEIKNDRATHGTNILPLSTVMQFMSDVPLIKTPVEADVLFWKLYIDENDSPFEAQDFNTGETKYAQSFEDRDDSEWFMDAVEQTDSIYDDDELPW